MATPYHIVHVVVGRHLPVDGLVHLVEDDVAVVLVLHQLLQAADLEPAHPLTRHHLLHQLGV